ncbi:MAG: type II toxin-antitoxin system VapC family toxin [Deltaproteobacteria bacterium]|nr:type II toxin-antitoxin system VapC family toxin [Deltaproteobacteria bacterium]
MIVVVDTDVAAAALLGEPERGAEAGRLLSRKIHLLAPAHWQAELANVIWKATLQGRLPIDQLDRVMELASRLPVESVEVRSLWRGAVALAVAHAHPVYDTLFVELARRVGARLASYDRVLREKFSELVSEPKEILG